MEEERPGPDVIGIPIVNLRNSFLLKQLNEKHRH